MILFLIRTYGIIVLYTVFSNFLSLSLKHFRDAWYYERGNFNLLRDKAPLFDWESLRDSDINVYADNINTTINSMANECIHKKHILVKPSYPPWLTTFLKHYIRKRKRAFRKAKKHIWNPTGKSLRS